MEDQGLPTRLSFGMGDREQMREEAAQYYAMFLGVLKAAGDLCTRNRSGSYGPPSTNFLNSDEGYLQVLWLKISRLINMVEVKREVLASDGWASWVSFDRGMFADSLIDLINYAAFWATDIVLAGQWPDSLQAQPDYYEAPLVDDDDVGVETVQCPRCQSLRHGFFGRVDGAWVIGCKSCGIRRVSQQVGSHLAWYAETRGSRAFVRGRYGTQGDPTHRVKTVELKTVQKADGGEDVVGVEAELEVLDLAGDSVEPRAYDAAGEVVPESGPKIARLREIVSKLKSTDVVTSKQASEFQELMAEMRVLRGELDAESHLPESRQVEKDGRRDPLPDPTVTVERMSNRELPRTLRDKGPKPPGGAHRNPVYEPPEGVEEEDEGVRPDRQPKASTTEPIQKLECSCGAQGNVFLVKTAGTSMAKLKRFKDKKTALQFRCSEGCKQSKEAVDMRELTRFLEGQRVKAKVLPKASVDGTAPAQE